MRKLPHSTKVQLQVATKLKYKEISLNVSLANQIFDDCCEHLKAKYPYLSLDKTLEIAILQTGNLINNPEFLFKDVDG